MNNETLRHVTRYMRSEITGGDLATALKLEIHDLSDFLDALDDTYKALDQGLEEAKERLRIRDSEVKRLRELLAECTDHLHSGTSYCYDPETGNEGPSTSWDYDADVIVAHARAFLDGDD